MSAYLTMHLDHAADDLWFDVESRALTPDGGGRPFTALTITPRIGGDSLPGAVTFYGQGHASREVLDALEAGIARARADLDAEEAGRV